MISKRMLMLSTAMIPVAVFAGVVAGGAVMTEEVVVASARAACQPCNPCAVAKPCSPCAPVNPCAAANPCSPCSPCAAGGGTTVAACAVPRLQSAAAANPCAVAKPCNPCSPCAAANPCSPCAAANPCNPCNPCATAKPCSPCSPCAAANPCNPCNPCGAGAAVELTDAEAVAAYDCLLPTMTAGYQKSGRDDAADYTTWRRYSRRAYVSETHGSRYVQNYANATAKAYGNYENAGTFPAGATLAKDSFTVDAKGEVSAGPLFLMEKMEAGFNPESDDWRYTMVTADGTVTGTTKGQGSDNVAFCIGCHQSVTPEQDNVMLLPEEYRVK